MKLISWNVKWLKGSSTEKDLKTFFKNINADIFCIQETKMQEDQIDIELNRIF